MTSKSSPKSEKLSYEIIDRELIKYAKELQLEIQLESQGLPVPPVTKPSENQKAVQRKVEIPRNISEI